MPLPTSSNQTSIAQMKQKTSTCRVLKCDLGYLVESISLIYTSIHPDIKTCQKSTQQLFSKRLPRLTCRSCGAPWPSPPALWFGLVRSAVHWCSRCLTPRGRSLPAQTALCRTRAPCGWRRSRAAGPTPHHPSAADTGSTWERNTKWLLLSLIKTTCWHNLLFYLTRLTPEPSLWLSSLDSKCTNKNF